jgi:hypothetical protein
MRSQTGIHFIIVKNIGEKQWGLFAGVNLDCNISSKNQGGINL